LECGGSTPLSFFGLSLFGLVESVPAGAEKQEVKRKKESGVEPPHSKGPSCLALEPEKVIHPCRSAAGPFDYG